MKRSFFPVYLALAHKRKKNHNPGPYLGYAVKVPREGKKDVKARIYRPAAGPATLPVLFNVHGGAWIFGDAEGVDLQSQYLANHLGCIVVNIDYRLAYEYPFPYQQTEVADTVEYFLTHADKFHIDPARAALMGHSAGGHISAGAAMLLRNRGVRLSAQVLCYPFLNFIGFSYADYAGVSGAAGKLLTRFSEAVLFEKLPKDDVMISPGNADPEALRGLADAVILSCGANDPLLPQAEQYAAKLEQAGVKVTYREYTEAEHGFMERGFRDDPAVFAKESKQDTLMRQGVEFLREQKIFDRL